MYFNIASTNHLVGFKCIHSANLYYIHRVRPVVSWNDDVRTAVGTYYTCE